MEIGKNKTEKQMEFVKEKHLKNYISFFITIACFVTTFSNINAQEAPASAAVWRRKFGPGFEIINKSKNKIWVTLRADEKTKLEKTEVPAGATLSADISDVKDHRATLMIRIFTSPPNKLLKPDYIYKVIDAKGLTKYLTWNPEKYKNESKYLYPQTGPYLGVLGTTETGYSLEKNLSQNNIYKA